MFSMIMPVYDPSDRLVDSGAIHKVVKSVLALEGEYELVVVNNNPFNTSPKLTRYLQELPATDSRLKSVHPGENLGTARGFNVGFAAASQNATYLVYMSVDADLIDANLLLQAEEFMRVHPDVGIAHPYSVFEDYNPFNCARRYSRKAFERIIRSRTDPQSVELTGAELRHIQARLGRRIRMRTMMLRTMPLTWAVIRRDVFHSIGGFDEELQLACGENNDFAYRALQAGFRIARMDNSFVNHRRYYFRCLVGKGGPVANSAVALRQSANWWQKKYGRPYIEVYYKHLLGMSFILLYPAFFIRRLLSRLKRRVVSGVQ